MTRLRNVFLTAAMAGGLLLPSSEAIARRHICMGSIERGNVPFLMKKDRRSTIVNTPLLEDGKHLRLQLPAGYMKEVGSASASMSAEEKTRFTSAAIQSNIGFALSTLSTRRAAKFYCVDPKQAQPAPVTGPARPAPAPRPAPRTDDDNRRRVIFIDVGEPAPRQNHAPPLMPSHKGGSGTRASPHVIEVPVPSQKGAGTVMFHHMLDVSLATLGLGSLHFDLRFVKSQSPPRTTSRRQLTDAIYGMVERIVKQKLAAAGKQQPASMSSLRGSINRIVANAATFPEIKAYAK